MTTRVWETRSTGPRALAEEARSSPPRTPQRRRRRPKSQSPVRQQQQQQQASEADGDDDSVDETAQFVGVQPPVSYVPGWFIPHPASAPGSLSSILCLLVLCTVPSDNLTCCGFSLACVAVASRKVARPSAKLAAPRHAAAAGRRNRRFSALHQTADYLYPRDATARRRQSRDSAAGSAPFLANGERRGGAAFRQRVGKGMKHSGQWSGKGEVVVACTGPRRQALPTTHCARWWPVSHHTIAVPILTNGDLNIHCQARIARSVTTPMCCWVFGHAVATSTQIRQAA